MRRADAAMQGVAAEARVVLADAAARLDGVGRDAADHEAVLDDMRGLREPRVGRRLVAELKEEGTVVGTFLPHRRRALFDRRLEPPDRGQRLERHLDHLGRVLRLLQRFGDDIGDLVADEAHPLADQPGVRVLIHGRAVFALARDAAARGAEPVRLDIVGGEHAEHAGRGFRLGGIQLGDARMRVRRAQHIAVGLVRQRYVMDVEALAAQQPRIFLARHGLAESELTHLVPLNSSLYVRGFENDVREGFYRLMAAGRNQWRIAPVEADRGEAGIFGGGELARMVGQEQPRPADRGGDFPVGFALEFRACGQIEPAREQPGEVALVRMAEQELLRGNRAG